MDVVKEKKENVDADGDEKAFRVIIDLSEAEHYALGDTQRKWRIKAFEDLVCFGLTALEVAGRGQLLVQGEDGKIQRIMPPPYLCEEERAFEAPTWH